MRQSVALIVVAELLGTSLWFSANAAAGDLARQWGLTTVELGYLTSSVNAGFITGTLIFSLSGLADRWSSSRIFAFSAVFGAWANGGFAWLSGGLDGGLVWRFLTGLALAGVYPLGMKLVVSWEPEARGQALGWLVGMLVIGTALPHLLHAAGGTVDWRLVVSASSVLALVAAGMIAALGEGPHAHPAGRRRAGGVLAAFRDRRFRGAVLGYWGHMWELYAVWTLTPLMAALALGRDSADSPAVSLLSFGVIAAGGVGCIMGGRVSRRVGSAPVAFALLSVSGLVCVFYPVLAPVVGWPTVLVLLLWGWSISSDSPQFSSLAAATCPPAYVGSALAIQNAVGFAISIASIQLLTGLWPAWGPTAIWLLVPGPVFGLVAMIGLFRHSGKSSGPTGRRETAS